MIYLDHAATALPKLESAAQACADAVLTWGNSGRGGHECALNASRGILQTRVLLAERFGLEEPERVCFTSGITEALNLALRGLLKPGDHVITTAMEHNSVLRPLYLLEREGVELTILPADESGCVDWTLLESAIRENSRVLVCQHASNVTGNVTDLAKLGAVCREHGMLLVVDAAQTAGELPIDMKRDQIDVLCITGHKCLRGPQGIGAVLVGERADIRPYKAGGTGVHSTLKYQPEELPTRLEAGTLNGPGIAGLRAALEYNREHGAEDAKRAANLAALFLRLIRYIPGVRVYGTQKSVRAPVVAINIGGYDSALVSDELEQRFGIATRPGIHCAPLAHEALGTAKQGVVRFSFAATNTEEEVRTAAEAVRILATE